MHLQAMNCGHFNPMVLLQPVLVPGGVSDIGTGVHIWDCSYCWSDGSTSQSNQQFNWLPSGLIQWRGNKERCLQITKNEQGDPKLGQITLQQCDTNNIDQKFNIHIKSKTHTQHHTTQHHTTPHTTLHYIQNYA